MVLLCEVLFRHSIATRRVLVLCAMAASIDHGSLPATRRRHRFVEPCPRAPDATGAFRYT